MKLNLQFATCSAAIITAIAMMAGTCYAGAWTAKKGVMYNRFSANYYAANNNFDGHHNRTEFAGNGDFRDANGSWYVEYGLMDQLTLIGSLTYKKIKYEDDTLVKKTKGFSDIELGAKYRLLTTRGGVLSVQGLIKIPEAYDKNDPLPLGNGQYDTEIRLLYGRSLYPVIPGYFNVEAGYRFRAETPADEFRYLLEFGYDFSSSAYGRVKLDGTYGMGNAGNSANTSGNPSATFDCDLGKLDLCLGYKVNKAWGVEAGCRPEIYGKNTSAGVNWSLALVYIADLSGK